MSAKRTSGRLGVLLTTLVMSGGCMTAQTRDDPPTPNAPTDIAGTRETAGDDGTKPDLTESGIAARKIYLSGCEFLARNMLDTAMLEFEKCVALKPNFAPAYFKMSQSYFLKERYKEEIEMLEKCVRYAPNHEEAHLNLAHAYLMQDDLPQARDHYLKVIELDPNHPIAHYDVGLVFFDLAQFAKAADHLRVAIDTGKLRPDLLERADHYLKRALDRK